MTWLPIVLGFFTAAASVKESYPELKEYSQGRTVWSGAYSPAKKETLNVVVVPNYEGMSFIHVFSRDSLVYRDSFEINTGNKEWFIEDFNFDGYADIGIVREHAQNIDVQPFLWNPATKSLDKVAFTFGSFKLDSAKKVFIQSGRTGGPGMRIISYQRFTPTGLETIAKCEGYYDSKGKGFRFKFGFGKIKFDHPMTGDPNDIFELCDEDFDKASKMVDK